MFQYSNHLLFDAAAADERQNEALKVGTKQQSFYKGDKEENRSASPYLLELQTGSPLANRYFKLGWGQSWGVAIHSSAPFEEIYKHFRRFLMIKTEDSERLYFRFYDPRVLRIFLPTCDAAQIREFFGNAIDYFLCEDEDPDFALRFSHQNGILHTERFSVKDEIAALPEPEPMPVPPEAALPPESIAALKEQGVLEQVLEAMGISLREQAAAAQPQQQPPPAAPITTPRQEDATAPKPPVSKPGRNWNVFD